MKRLRLYAACRSIMIMFFRWPNSKSMGQVVSSGEACPADEGAEERSSDSGDMYMQGLGFRVLNIISLGFRVKGLGYLVLWISDVKSNPRIQLAQIALYVRRSMPRG